MIIPKANKLSSAEDTHAIIALHKIGSRALPIISFSKFPDENKFTNFVVGPASKTS